MYSRATVSLSTAHRARLEELFAEPERMTLVGLTWRLVGIGVGAALVLTFAVGSQAGWQFVAFTLAAAGLMAGSTLWRWRQDALEVAAADEALQRGLLRNEAIVERFAVAEAIELDLPHGEWPAYLFRLRDGRIALVQGPFLHQPPCRFPSTVFELVEAPAANACLGLFCLGEPLDPQLERTPEAIPWDDLPETLVFSGDWDAGPRGLLEQAVAEAAAQGKLEPAAPSGA